LKVLIREFLDVFTGHSNSSSFVRCRPANWGYTSIIEVSRMSVNAGSQRKGDQVGRLHFQLNNELATLVGTHLDASVQESYQALAERKAKAAMVRGVGSSNVPTPKALEQPRRVLGRDEAATVGDFDDCAAVVSACCDADLTAFVDVRDSVVEK